MKSNGEQYHIVLDYELPNNPFQPWSEHSASQRQGNKCRTDPNPNPNPNPKPNAGNESNERSTQEAMVESDWVSPLGPLGELLGAVGPLPLGGARTTVLADHRAKT